MRRVLGRLSYANVTATLALFIALGGVSYAATKLPKNSVGSSQIVNKSVKSADLAGNAVTTAKVRDGSLLAADFAAGQLPAGARGATGPAGTNGTNGTNGTKGDKGDNGKNGATSVTYHVMQTPNVASGSDIDEEPSCGAGETLIGGGGLFVLPSTTTVVNNSVRITGSGPASGTNASQSPSNWYVAGNNFSGSPLDFIGYAVCASP